VSEKYRNRGIGQKLVHTILQNARGDVYLATISPDYFVKLGFERASHAPAPLIKPPDWCSGCRKELCAVLVKKSE
jgi:N-acetylglutamate synthase-like GNAT family acetyltransferase